MTTRYARTALLAVPIAVLVALFALLVAGQLEQTVPGLPDAGSLVRLGLPVARTVQDLAAALTVGLLVVAATVLPPASPDVGDELVGHRARAVRFAAASSTCWLLVGSLTLVLTYADVAGLSPTAPGFASQLGYFLRSFDLGRSAVASLVVAAVVSIGTMLATRTSTVGWLALGSVLALWPVALAGHVAGSDDHEAAVDSLAVHLVSVSFWVGGLAALVLLSPWLKASLRVSVQRYSTLAGWCFALVAVSGGLNAWLRLGSLAGLTTAYGALVLVKTFALVLLGTAGWWHRRVTIPGLVAGGPHARRDFWRLATVEVLVMGATIGVAVALSRSAPPVSQSALPEGADAVTALLGYPYPPPLTGLRWLTSWYVEPIWAGLSVLGALWYVLAYARMRRRGDHWPAYRVVLWLLGCAVLLWATSGAPGVYGRTAFSLHMVQHMTLMMVVPMLLVMSAPVTIALRTLRTRTDGSRGPREWLLAVVHSRALSVLANPVVVGALFIGSLFVFYYSRLFELALSTHTGHMLMNVHFLAVGYLFAWVMMGPDPGPARPSYPVRILILLVTVSAHAFFALGIMAETTVLAGDWFAALGQHDTAALLADQRVGGGIAWGLAEIPTLVMATIVAAQWSRSDDREARRRDRQADRDGDAELTAYNTYLSQLTDRD